MRWWIGVVGLWAGLVVGGAVQAQSSERERALIIGYNYAWTPRQTNFNVLEALYREEGLDLRFPRRLRGFVGGWRFGGKGGFLEVMYQMRKGVTSVDTGGVRFSIRERRNMVSFSLFVGSYLRTGIGLGIGNWNLEQKQGPIDQFDQLEWENYSYPNSRLNPHWEKTPFGAVILYPVILNMAYLEIRTSVEWGIPSNWEAQGEFTGSPTSYFRYGPVVSVMGSLALGKVYAPDLD